MEEVNNVQVLVWVYWTTTACVSIFYSFMLGDGRTLPVIVRNGVDLLTAALSIIAGIVSVLPRRACISWYYIVQHCNLSIRS
jgi:hypothetical protein